jgi:hypothetical protein
MPTYFIHQVQAKIKLYLYLTACLASNYSILELREVRQKKPTKNFPSKNEHQKA